jgi:hypothetical protein
VLGAGAGGKTSSTFTKLDADGDEQKCSNATLADKSPPDGCGALLRLEMLGLGADKPIEASCPEKSTWDGKECVHTEVVTKVDCPEGAILDGDQCVAPVVKTAAQKSLGCRYGDATDCTMQCQVQNDPASCADLALMHASGVGVQKDLKKAVELYLRACDLGSAVGCDQAGMRLEDGLGATKDEAKAVTLYQKGVRPREARCVHQPRAHARQRMGHRQGRRQGGRCAHARVQPRRSRRLQQLGILLREGARRDRRSHARRVAPAQRMFGGEQVGLRRAEEAGRDALALDSARPSCYLPAP